MIAQENTSYTEEEVKAIIRQNEELRKKYNNVLEKAEQIYNSDFKPDEAAVLAKYLPMIFPELKEIQNETIKQEIRNFIWQYPDKLPERDRWLDWFDKQDDNKESDEEWEVTTGLYKCTKQMFDSSPERKLLFETGKLYKCTKIHRCVTNSDVALFESPYSQPVFLTDSAVRKHFIKVKDTTEKQDDQKPADKIEPKFKPGDCISNGRYVKKIIDINSDWPYYMFQDGSSYRIKEIDTKWHIMPNMDELEWMNVHTDEDHCYSCELFDRKNNMCKCITLCKDPHNTYKGFYVR